MFLQTTKFTTCIKRFSFLYPVFSEKKSCVAHKMFLRCFDIQFLAVLLWRGIFMIIQFSFCRKNEQDLFNIVGSMYALIVFFGINNCSSVLPFVATERTVLYRERFAGMYSSWAYSFAQVSDLFRKLDCLLSCQVHGEI